MKLLVFLLFFTQILYSHTLELNISQDKTKITINNKEYSTNVKNNLLKINFENGEYRLKICKQNYKCFSKKIWIMDSDLKVNINLEPLKSTLIITSNNVNSIILINGKEVDKNRVLEFKKSQTIEIEEKKDYFTNSKMKFKINLGDEHILNLPKLKAIKKTLSINSLKSYEELSLRLDGKEICKSTVCDLHINAGSYHLFIIADGFYSYEKDFKITDKDIKINYELKRIPKKLQFGVELSYLYDRLLGGYPELDIDLKIKNKVNFKLGILYVVNFSNDSEYYGLVLGSSYDIYKKGDTFELYAGMDLIFSKYIDNSISYLLNGVGLNLGGQFKIVKDLFMNFEITNRLYYMYNKDYYNILGKLGVLYRF